MIIKCNTPEEVRNRICDWLAALAIDYSTQSRLASHKTVGAKLKIQADTIAAAAAFIREIRIEVL